MKTPRRVGAVLLSLGVALAVAALSRFPATRAGADTALLRLSWRMEPFAIEHCRTLTPEELARIPAHMRRDQECTRATVDYELTVQVASLPTVVDTVSPSGARRDRPVYVLSDLPVAPGSHQVVVTFTPVAPPGAAPGDIPAAVRWSGVVALEPAEIGLVTMDESGALFLAQGG